MIDPETGTEMCCPITMEPMSQSTVDFLTGKTARWFVPSMKHLVAIRLPCSHTFSAVPLACHFAISNCRCPICRAGHDGRLNCDQLPVHLQRSVRIHVAKMDQRAASRMLLDDRRMALHMEASEVLQSFQISDSSMFDVIRSAAWSDDEHDPMELVVYMYTSTDVDTGDERISPQVDHPSFSGEPIPPPSPPHPHSIHTPPPVHTPVSVHTVTPVQTLAPVPLYPFPSMALYGPRPHTPVRAYPSLNWSASTDPADEIRPHGVARRLRYLPESSYDILLDTPTGAASGQDNVDLFDMPAHTHNENQDITLSTTTTPLISSDVPLSISLFSSLAAPSSPSLFATSDVPPLSLLSSGPTNTSVIPSPQEPVTTDHVDPCSPTADTTAGATTNTEISLHIGDPESPWPNTAMDTEWPNMPGLRLLPYCTISLHPEMVNNERRYSATGRSLRHLFSMLDTVEADHFMMQVR